MLKNKESKIRILENFYAIDRIVFGKPLSEIETCCPGLLDEYVTTKGAMLSVLVDMYNLTDHQPEKIEEKIDFSKISENSITLCDEAKANSKAIISSDKGKILIKEKVKEIISEDADSDMNEVLDATIKESLISIALDNLLIGNAISESQNIDGFNSIEGRILEDAYKTLKTDLMEIASLIIED
jgi:hypothetical protein